MPKRIVFYFIGFVMVASLAFYGFNRWKDSREKVDLWTLVPESAVLVLETNNHAALIQHLRETGLWESFSILPFAQRLEEDLAALDSVAPGSQRLSRFLDEKDILTSLHVVGKADVGYVYYVPVATVAEHRFLRTLTENIGKSDVYQEETREYQGILLTDIANTRLGTRFTYFTYHNNIVLSPSAVLVEEIVRRVSREQTESLAGEFRNTSYLGKPQVYANVFVNYRTLPDFLGLFLKQEVMPQVRYLSSLTQSAMLELKLERDKIFLNGFSSPEKLKNSLHQLMQSQKPQLFGLKAYLPSRTALLLHFGLAEIARLRLPRKENTSVYAVTVDSLAKSLSEEAALVFLESPSISAIPEKVAFAHVANPAATEKLVGSLSMQLATARKQKPVTEQYGNYTIQLLNVPELPAELLGKAFSGFEQSYVVQVGDYLLLSERAATLRTVLNDISEENVWGKSVMQKAFLEQTLQEANFSLYLNSVNAWYMLNRYVEDTEREDLLQNASLIKQFNQLSLQFSKVEQQYYTSLVIRRPSRGNSGAGQDIFASEQTLSFGSRLETRPFPVQNPNDRSREVVVQDSAGVLHNISANAQRGWVDSLGVSIRGTILQAEMGPEQKLRYLFATANHIHALNEQGQELENFPFNLGDSLSIQHLAVFDYENDRNHRLLIDDSMGNLYMYDSRGAAVQGWQPRRMDYRLATAPQHLRVGGRDVIVVVLENGYIYALNRQGDTYPGFPINLKSPVTGSIAVNIGADLRRTTLTSVTRYGSVVTFNLQGKVLNREQLYRPSKRAMFELEPEGSQGRSSIIVRQEQGKVTVFDQDLNQVFEKRYVTSAPKIVQYFNFGGANRIYAITETGPQKTYLYDAEGNLIGNRILESSQPVTLYYNEASNRYTLYKVFRRELKQIDFKLPD
ncbi:hypothetical protein MKJ04_10335 [Pontibacter sp. E15-1]|uniref:hypothetical protein n=1 Tax=Pontibacter sp. E15-1 TaxID=2919918 RepID=UPI001F4F209C|nr:hypothetical protein [Pontibacter sp. E15-1]MCJ8165241.1 hypothetical protein [Pontibacter sp. E15-1]